MAGKKISVLGCGWLGLPLAKYLKNHGYIVKGSTTSSDKIKCLESEGIDPFVVCIADKIERDSLSVFFDSEVLILNIPFKRNLINPLDYKKQIRVVISLIESSSIKFVVFASSTSVYPALEINAVETNIILPDTQRAKVLLETEQLLLENLHFKTTVIRFGGMYGNGRSMTGFFSGKKGATQSDRPVNLIHLDDCVQIVARIINKDIQGEIFNAVSDEHPNQKELYTKMASKLGMQAPVFDETKQSDRKVVSNVKVKQFLNYQFQHPNPLEF